MNGDMTKESYAFFVKHGYITANGKGRMRVSKSRTSYDLLYLGQGIPNGSNAPYGVCMKLRNDLIAGGGYCMNGFKITPVE